MQLIGDLLVGVTASDEPEHFPFAGCDAEESIAQSISFALAAVPDERYSAAAQR
jgi:hypothetical protein